MVSIGVPAEVVTEAADKVIDDDPALSIETVWAEAVVDVFGTTGMIVASIDPVVVLTEALGRAKLSAVVIVNVPADAITSLSSS